MKKVMAEQLRPGMITAEDVYTLSGQLLVSKRTVITDALIVLINAYSVFSVLICDSSDEDLSAPSQAPSADYSGKDIPGFVSNLPEEVRKIRIEKIETYKKDFAQGVNYFQVSLNNLISENTDLDVNTILDQTLALINSGNHDGNILEMLIYMKEFDDNIYAHSVNVSLLCNMLAHWLNYSEDDCRMAAACGLFHDLGMLAIPEEILKKNGPLTAQERETVNTHAQKGYHLLQNYQVDGDILQTALMHHEKCDGSGYPNGLKAGEINPFAKLVTICDVYNAMTSARPYRSALSPFAGIEQFESDRMRKYDTAAILRFLENTANTYLNCPVRLSNGMAGYVVYINPNHLGRPTVQCGSQFFDLSKQKELHVMELLPAL